MAQFEKRIRTTTAHQYVLPNPANQAEFQKAMSYAYQEYGDNTGREVYDDSIWVTHADEEIIIYWEEKK
jgi:hypothetical protein